MSSMPPASSGLFSEIFLVELFLDFIKGMNIKATKPQLATIIDGGTKPLDVIQ